jgi:hypothetical protein
MKSTLLAFAVTAAVLTSAGAARAQPRYSTFNNSLILSPGLPSSSFPQSSFTPSFGNPSFLPPASGYSSGIGNFGPYVGNGYTYPSGAYNGTSYYPSPAYGSSYYPSPAYGQNYRRYFGYGRGYYGNY